MRPSNKEMIDVWFHYHKPLPHQVNRYDAIRSAARQFAQVLVENSPVSADQTAALRKLRECVMTVNAAIACDTRGLEIEISQVADEVTVKATHGGLFVTGLTRTKGEVLSNPSLLDWFIRELTKLTGFEEEIVRSKVAEAASAFKAQLQGK